MAWATDSKSNLFLWARLKLTFIYIVIITSILVVFSVGLYININKNIKRNVSDKKEDSVGRQYAIQQSDDRLKEMLFMGNFAILFFSGGLSFFLAGENLKPIKKVLEKQKRFTADASHDLRTPLSIMKTDCEVILKKKAASNEELRWLVSSNLEEINRMSAMVEQLLFLSRNNGVLNQQMGAINPSEIMKKIAINCKGLAENKNISLSVGDTVAANMNGNKLNLEKMFLNIMKNAIDYTPEGGKIQVTARKNKNHIEISISDNGVGIAPEDLPHVTEAFYKVDKIRGQENGGSGLGLSIVNEIVKSHGAALHIESELNKGTTVNLTFPLIS